MEREIYAEGLRTRREGAFGFSSSEEEITLLTALVMLVRLVDSLIPSGPKIDRPHLSFGPGVRLTGNIPVCPHVVPVQGVVPAASAETKG